MKYTITLLLLLTTLSPAFAQKAPDVHPDLTSAMDTAEADYRDALAAIEQLEAKLKGLKPGEKRRFQFELMEVMQAVFVAPKAHMRAVTAAANYGIDNASDPAFKKERPELVRKLTATYMGPLNERFQGLVAQILTDTNRYTEELEKRLKDCPASTK